MTTLKLRERKAEENIQKRDAYAPAINRANMTLCKSNRPEFALSDVCSDEDGLFVEVSSLSSVIILSV